MNPIDFAAQASSNPWWFFGAALVLGALHGLEPGHSKGIMTAFVVGTRGSYFQAVVLAVCATLSHTAVVWVLAVPASFGGVFWADVPVARYLSLASGIVVLFLAWWMLRRLNRGHVHHGHSHHHHDDVAHGHEHEHEHEHHHHHEPESGALAVAFGEEDDEHARHHLREIAERFSGQEVSTGQVALFGLSSGLAPCSAAIVILITCFRLHEPWLGLALVAAFSLGLGFTLTSVAVLASWGVRAVGARSKGFAELVANAPFLSALVTAAIGVYLIVQFFRSY